MTTRDVPDQGGDLPPIGRRGLLAMHGVGPKAVGILEAAAADRGIPFAP